MDHHHVARLISLEHPQTIAVALFRMSTEDAGEILKYLPQPLQVDVISRISKIERLPDEVLEDIDSLLNTLLQ